VAELDRAVKTRVEDGPRRVTLRAGDGAGATYDRRMGSPLGDFVRARRDATRPEDVGVVVGPRRRVPGLRRAELADRAGISVEYLVRIEQGSDRNPSASVLHALADALRLDAADRQRLTHLTAIADDCQTPDDDGRATEPREVVRASVLAVLDRLEPTPAVVVNRLGDVLAVTAGFDRLARPSGILDGDRPNLTRYVFTDPRARRVFPDWDRVADERAAEIWLGSSGERAVRFSRDLAHVAGGPFTDRLVRHPPTSAAPLRWVHPEAGELRLERETLELPAADAQQLVVHLPADAATAAALEALRHADAVPLRVVG
jgi:transcriptional regulator with XRE-family HTH domain